MNGLMIITGRQTPQTLGGEIHGQRKYRKISKMVVQALAVNILFNAHGKVCDALWLINGTNVQQG